MEIFTGCCLNSQERPLEVLNQSIPSQIFSLHNEILYTYLTSQDLQKNNSFAAIVQPHRKSTILVHSHNFLPFTHVRNGNKGQSGTKLRRPFKATAALTYFIPLNLITF